MTDVLTHLAAFSAGCIATWQTASFIIRKCVTEKLCDGGTLYGTDRRTGERFAFARMDLPKEP